MVKPNSLYLQYHCTIINIKTIIMKTTMRLFMNGLIILTLVFTSCSKDGEIGPIGPAGTSGIDGIDGTDGIDGIDGTDGTDGVDGVDGVDGNADVRLLEYGSETITTGSITYEMEGVTLAIANEYLILGFYANIYQTPNAGNSFVTKKQWIPVPGRGESGLFETRSFVDASSALLSGVPTSDFEVRLYQLGSLIAYTTEVTFDEFKIFVIPPSTTGKNSNVEFGKMTYEELIHHFGLEN